MRIGRIGSQISQLGVYASFATRSCIPQRTASDRRSTRPECRRLSTTAPGSHRTAKPKDSSSPASSLPLCARPPRACPMRRACRTVAVPVREGGVDRLRRLLPRPPRLRVDVPVGRDRGEAARRVRVAEPHAPPVTRTESTSGKGCHHRLDPDRRLNKRCPCRRVRIAYHSRPPALHTAVYAKCARTPYKHNRTRRETVSHWARRWRGETHRPGAHYETIVRIRSQLSAHSPVVLRARQR